MRVTGDQDGQQDGVLPEPAPLRRRRRLSDLGPEHVKTGLWILAGFLVIWAFTRLPFPELHSLREWAADLGPWFIVAFFLANALLTVAPIPRTSFTYAAAFLFPPSVAIPLALAALTVSGSIGFLLGRRFGYDRIEKYRSNPYFQRVDRHLRQRGWATVLSLRMVPAIPFSILSIAASLSSVRFAPYLVATVLGSAPGTIVTILLGDAVTSGSMDGAFWALVGIAVLGVVGLALEARLAVKDGFKNVE